eukprot:TRINITY_DN3079_c0_g2_i1.p1 TRINITY_DN3079_c0_g2~~TRINITY_DN3079_c0_g2_i1.p1  ORF type:complete len:417 (+),score=71.23 TRINITY_DN3079_c0_g2_i1:63-1313(+)
MVAESYQAHFRLASMFLIGIAIGQLVMYFGTHDTQRQFLEISNTTQSLLIGSDALREIPAALLKEWFHTPSDGCPTRVSLSAATQQQSTAADDALRPFHHSMLSAEECYCAAWTFFIRFYAEYDSPETFMALERLLLSWARGKDNDRFARFLPSTGALIVDVGAGRAERLLLWRELISASHPMSGKDFKAPATPQPRIILVEPNPDAVTVVEKAIVGTNDVMILSEVVHSQSQRVVFQLPNRKGSARDAQARIFHGNAKAAGAHITVQAKTMDAVYRNSIKPLVKNIQGNLDKMEYPIYMLHISTTGSEERILSGAKEMLKHVRMIVFKCEIWMIKNRRGPGSTHKQIQQHLEGYGFVTFKMHPYQMVPFSGEFYHKKIDVPKFMGSHICLAVRKSDPIMEEMLSSFNIFESCQVN